MDVGADNKSDSVDDVLPIARFIEDGFKVQISDTAVRCTRNVIKCAYGVNNKE